MARNVKISTEQISEDLRDVLENEIETITWEITHCNNCKKIKQKTFEENHYKTFRKITIYYIIHILESLNKSYDFTKIKFQIVKNNFIKTINKDYHSFLQNTINDMIQPFASSIDDKNKKNLFYNEKPKNEGKFYVLKYSKLNLGKDFESLMDKIGIGIEIDCKFKKDQKMVIIDFHRIDDKHK